MTGWTDERSAIWAAIEGALYALKDSDISAGLAWVTEQQKLDVVFSALSALPSPSAAPDIDWTDDQVIWIERAAEIIDANAFDHSRQGYDGWQPRREAARRKAKSILALPAPPSAARDKALEEAAQFVHKEGDEYLAGADPKTWHFEKSERAAFEMKQTGHALKAVGDALRALKSSPPASDGAPINLAALTPRKETPDDKQVR